MLNLQDLSFIRWLAPECITSVDDHTHASDVWSYGVLLYELATNGMTSFAHLQNYNKF